FYLILSAIALVGAGLFWRLLVASLVMLIAGYLGEVHYEVATGAGEAVSAAQLWGYFIVGTAAWLYIIYEIFAGEASKINAASGTKASKRAFATMKWIVTIGWAIYPLGYLYGYAGGGNVDVLNGVYNLADFVNKIAFGVAIWAAATSSDAMEKAEA
ncbi:MAG: bacteriorhodopsin, partial [Pseudomonadota bacterium]